jgi:hypothetical protein
MIRASGSTSEPVTAPSYRSPMLCSTPLRGRSTPEPDRVQITASGTVAAMVATTQRAPTRCGHLCGDSESFTIAVTVVDHPAKDQLHSQHDDRNRAGDDQPNPA